MRRLAVALVLVLGGCGSSHGPAKDASTADGRPVPETGAVCPREEEPECGCLGGFRRCDTCDLDCPVPISYCNEALSVCELHPGPGPQDDCEFSATDSTIDGDRDGYCSTGQVCVALYGGGPADESVSGPCMPPEYCTDLQTADPPVDDAPSCFYSDGTRVITGPPTDGECPASDPRMPFCGGVCGLRFCPTYEHPEVVLGPSTRYRDCVGLSDDRSFGICAYEQARCVRGLSNDFDLEHCAEEMGERCVCLVPRPQPDGTLPEHGYVVIESVCRQYAERFPDHAECVDGEWRPLGS